MYHIVICRKDYQAPFETKASVVFRKGEVYQAENRGDEYRVWRNQRSFLKFSPAHFSEFFRIFI